MTVTVDTFDTPKNQPIPYDHKALTVEDWIVVQLCVFHRQSKNRNLDYLPLMAKVAYRLRLQLEQWKLAERFKPGTGQICQDCCEEILTGEIVENVVPPLCRDCERERG